MARILIAEDEQSINELIADNLRLVSHEPVPVRFNTISREIIEISRYQPDTDDYLVITGE